MCEFELMLQTRPLLTCLLALTIALGVVGVAINVCLILALPKVRSLHGNARLLLINTSVGCILIGAAIIARYGHMLLVDALLGNPCAVSATPIECVYETAVGLIAASILYFSLVALGIERAFATRWAQIYANAESSFSMGAGLVVLTWLLSSITPLLYYRDALNFPPNSTLPICAPILLRPKGGAGQPLFYLLIEISAIALYAAVLWVNRRILAKFATNRAKYSLSERLQLRRNIEITDALLYSAVFHAICWLPILLGSPVIVSLASFEGLILWYHLIVLLTIAYSTAHPLVCFWRSKAMRKQARRLLGGVLKLEVAVSTVSKAPAAPRTAGLQDGHFEMLRSQWDNWTPLP